MASVSGGPNWDTQTIRTDRTAAKDGDTYRETEEYGEWWARSTIHALTAKIAPAMKPVNSAGVPPMTALNSARPAPDDAPRHESGATEKRCLS